MTNLLWFAEADVEEAEDAVMVRADDFVGVDPVMAVLCYILETLRVTRLLMKK